MCTGGGVGRHKKFFQEIMAENLLNLMKTINPQIQELIKPQEGQKESTRHTTVKMLKTSDRENVKSTHSRWGKERHIAFKRPKGYSGLIMRNNATQEAMEHHVGSLGEKRQSGTD